MNILEYCLGISVARVVHYPYGMRERIWRDEKEFLMRLFAEFNISPKKTGRYFLKRLVYISGLVCK